MKNVLLLVDVQQDFCPGGALAVAEADRVVPVINRLMNHFDYVVASKDWHPRTTVHFDHWPPHCIVGTAGAAFHPALQVSGIDEVVLKGTGNTDDGYSAFEATSADLTFLLEKNRTGRLFVAGLTTDYCVRNTVLDAVSLGFSVTVITDAVRAVDRQPGDGVAALREMEAAGAMLLDSSAWPESL